MSTLSAALQTALQGLSTGLATLTPGQLLQLGNHLSQSDQGRAALIVANMRATPGMAATFAGQLATIKNMPATVMQDINSALEDLAETPPDMAAFKQSLDLAQRDLIAAVTNTGVLGGLLAGL
jgi:hypothetical protein